MASRLTKKELLANIDDHCQDLTNSAVWQSSKEVFGKIKKGDIDYIYEFYCYMSIINDLVHNYSLIYNPGSAPNKNSFPAGRAANSKSRPKFIFSINGVEYQICNGTKIKARFEQIIAPDISFQIKNEFEIPSYKKINLIFDAKLKRGKIKKIRREIIYDFAEKINLIHLQQSKVNISFNLFKALSKNCIITNGACVKINPDYLLKKNIQIIIEFDTKKIFKVL